MTKRLSEKGVDLETEKKLKKVGCKRFGLISFGSEFSDFPELYKSKGLGQLERLYFLSGGGELTKYGLCEQGRAAMHQWGSLPKVYQHRGSGGMVPHKFLSISSLEWLM